MTVLEIKKSENFTMNSEKKAFSQDLMRKRPGNTSSGVLTSSKGGGRPVIRALANTRVMKMSSGTCSDLAPVQVDLNRVGVDSGLLHLLAAWQAFPGF